MEKDPIGLILGAVTIIFSLALLGRYMAKRCHQSGVLGELLMGVIIGNLGYFFCIKLCIILREGPILFNIMSAIQDHISLKNLTYSTINNPTYAKNIFNIMNSPQGINFIKVGYILDTFSRYGVIFLLFMVGLESSLTELRQLGREASFVAIIGVIAPMILGFFVTHYFIPNISVSACLFVGATLSATSIGITARVLSDMGKLHTREAKIILGAAMLDDVLGLIILAMVSRIIMEGHIQLITVVKLIFTTLSFFVGTLMIGPWILRKLIQYFHPFELWEAKLLIPFLFVMSLSWLATEFYLAAIVGAFLAGLLLDDHLFESERDPLFAHLQIKSLVAPLEAIFAPFFFTLVGIQVKLETFKDKNVLLIASGLTIVAIIGKLMSGFGANKKNNRLLIGIGMLPRGEVGLIFASMGRTLGVFSDSLFSAIVLMIFLTTLVTPLLLERTKK